MALFIVSQSTSLDELPLYCRGLVLKAISLFGTCMQIISCYSSRFSNLIGKKDPVATLATLILLSYAKLLEICFKSLFFGRLNYPARLRWYGFLMQLFDSYLSGKHILLFLAALLFRHGSGFFVSQGGDFSGGQEI